MRKKVSIVFFLGILIGLGYVLKTFSYISAHSPDQIEKKEELLVALIRKQSQTSKLMNVSVYFQNLQHGWSIAVDEKEAFAPASLFKMPLMMAYLKLAETDKKLLSNTLTIEAKHTRSYAFYADEGEKLEEGKSYSVETLLQKLIINSDNAANSILIDYFGSLKSPVMQYLFIHMGIPWRNALKEGDKISPKEYAIFFHSLYHASYLNQEMSEKALKLLSRSAYTQGLVAGIPTGTVVAHKFGKRDYTDNSLVQLHDCGIIYHPDTKYILCVMTKGTDMNEQTKMIKAISEYVFQGVTDGSI